MSALTQLKPGLSNKGIVERSACFHFHSDCVVSHNDVASVMVPFLSGITGSVKAEDFYKILESISEEEVALTVEEKELILSAGTTRAGFALYSDSVSPLTVEGEFFQLPESFVTGINFCQFSVSKDMTRPHLTCIHIRGRKISSSDNWRITQFIMEESSPLDFLLPSDFVSDLVKFPFTHVAKDLSWVHFADENSGAVFSLRLKAGDFIDVDSYFEIEGTQVSLPLDLIPAIEKAKVMTEGDHLLDIAVQLHIEPGKLICRGEKAVGWVEKEMAIDYSGPPIALLINPVFLQEILSCSNNVIIGEKSCLFESSNFRHALMIFPNRKKFKES